MPKDKTTLQVPEIGNNSRDQSYRHSLQPKGTGESPILRHTQSQNYGIRKKKVVKVPTIPETSDNDVKVSVVTENETKTQREKKNSRVRKHSQASSRLGLDNAAFEVEEGLKISRVDSAASSVRSSIRDPSVQSLTVVREQYCCCSKWTPCERTLFAIIGVLTCIIIILVTVVALIATKGENKTNVGLFQF